MFREGSGVVVGKDIILSCEPFAFDAPLQSPDVGRRIDITLW